MTTLFVDTNVLLYAVGGAHPAKNPCVELLRRIGSGDVTAHASTELVQEFLFHRLRRTTRAQALEEARHVVQLCVLHAFDERVLAKAIDLVDSSGIGGRDAIHVATALVAGFSQIVSLDAGLDAIAGIQRLTPHHLAVGPGHDAT